jgi:hypothetical protein
MNSIKLKILVIGESGVGKSRYVQNKQKPNNKIPLSSIYFYFYYSLLIRFTDDKFDPNEQPTIGVDFKVKNLEIDGDRIYLQIWDTGESFFWNFPVIFHGFHVSFFQLARSGSAH